MDTLTSQLSELFEAIQVLTRELKVAETRNSTSTASRLTPSETATLLFVGEHPECIVSDVGSFLGVQPTTMSSIVDRLAEKKLLSRKRKESNRRVVFLLLTKKGEAARREVLDSQMQICRAMLEALDARERPAFISSLARIGTSLKEQREQTDGT
jgi:DNA-binding MarR family transcriptional regulator